MLRLSYMRYLSIKKQRFSGGRTSRNLGFTLIEAMIYTAILSLLIVGFMRYAYDIHINDIELSHEIEDAYEN